MVPPQNGWFMVENLTAKDDLGVLFHFSLKKIIAINPRFQGPSHLQYGNLGPRSRPAGGVSRRHPGHGPGQVGKWPTAYRNSGKDN